jgi:histone H3/H4
MKKKQEKINTLIKRKNLVLLIQKNGIKRAGPDAFSELERYAENCIKCMIPLLIEELAINGRNTLKKEDISKVLRDMENRNKKTYPEV